MKEQMEKPSFLRKLENMQIGEQLPDVEIVVSITEPSAHLYSFITDHLVIVMASSTCPPCREALEAVDAYTRTVSGLNVLLMLDTSYEHLVELKGIFQDRVTVCYMPKPVMIDQLKVKFFPCALSIDSSGSIIASSAIRNLDELVQHCEPVRTMLSSVK